MSYYLNCERQSCWSDCADAFVVRIWQKQIFSWRGSFIYIMLVLYLVVKLNVLFKWNDIHLKINNFTYVHAFALNLIGRQIPFILSWSKTWRRYFFCRFFCFAFEIFVLVSTFFQQFVSWKPVLTRIGLQLLSIYWLIDNYNCNRLNCTKFQDAGTKFFR